MKMKFTKMHGLGNDYVYVNCFEDIQNLFEKISRFFIQNAGKMSVLETYKIIDLESPDFDEISEICE